MLAETPSAPIGILGAMKEEVAGLVGCMESVREVHLGMRTFYCGTLMNREVVLVISRIGKVAAASTVAALIHQFQVSEVIFTGVAGSLRPEVKVGDIVLAKRLLQHDMDASPLMPRFEIPLLDITWFLTPDQQMQQAERALRAVIHEADDHRLLTEEVLNRFQMKQPSFWMGDVISGDQFVSSHAQKKELQDSHPTALCVEMEGAAVAQICYEYQIPFTIIRTISDNADDHSEFDFPLFMKEVASRYSVEAIRRLLA
jgi:adenosylhomocysteine nucleosidase